jgi:GNAT superfamily N-acetyltransferase
MVKIVISNIKSSEVMQLFSELDDFFINFLGNDSHFYSRYNSNENINEVWLAYDNDIPVGCIAYRVKSSGVGEVKRLFVKNEYRGKGISKLLITAVEKHSKNYGDHTLHLSTRITLEPAISLYRNSGYIETYQNGLYVELEKQL